MSEILGPLQSKLITLFEDARTASGGDYPAYIKPYGGQLRNPKHVNGFPALYVDVPASFDITAEDGLGKLWDLDGDPELILFDKNSASGEDNRADIAKLIDWTLDALQGKTVTVDGTPIAFTRVRGRIMTDYDDKIAAAVLTLPVTAFKDV